MERWKPIKDYQGHDEVSNLGRVRSLDRTLPSGRTVKGRVLWPRKAKRAQLKLDHGMTSAGRCAISRTRSLGGVF